MSKMGAVFSKLTQLKRIKDGVGPQPLGKFL